MRASKPCSCDLFAGRGRPALRASKSMPKKQIAIFVVIDLILVSAVLVAAFHHVRILYVLLAFTLLSVINGICLIVTVVKRAGGSS
jgi:hypothetical protein